jgi:hypothetical protein
VKRFPVIDLCKTNRRFGMQVNAAIRWNESSAG